MPWRENELQNGQKMLIKIGFKTVDLPNLQTKKENYNLGGTEKQESFLFSKLVTRVCGSKYFFNKSTLPVLLTLEKDVLGWTPHQIFVCAEPCSMQAIDVIVEELHSSYFDHCCSTQNKVRCLSLRTTERPVTRQLSSGSAADITIRSAKRRGRNCNSTPNVPQVWKASGKLISPATSEKGVWHLTVNCSFRFKPERNTSLKMPLQCVCVCVCICGVVDPYEWRVGQWDFKNLLLAKSWKFVHLKKPIF